jgi:hypothetical protein
MDLELKHLSRRKLLSLGTASIGALGIASATSFDATAQTTANTTTTGFFNVLDFGAQAVSDVTRAWEGFDSTAAINAAINAAATAKTSPDPSMQGGGVVYIPRGTYRITSSILISHSNIQLVGEGKVATTLYGHDVSGAMISLNSNPNDPQVRSCAIQGIAMYGTSVPVAADYMIAMYSTSRCTLRDISFSARVSDSALLIENSWTNHFYDLHFLGYCQRAHIYINRASTGGLTSNALMFYGCNMSSNGTPTGILTESNLSGSTVGEMFVFNGMTCQGYQRAIWARHGECINISGYYGEANTTDIQIGDNSQGNAFVRSVSIDSWRVLSASNGILLEQCRDVNIGNGFANSTTNPIVIGEATGVTVMAGRDISDSISYAANSRTRTGVMVFDGDRHAAPDWPATPTPMGIIMRADSDTSGRHYKITVDDAGNLQTNEVAFGNQG